MSAESRGGVAIFDDFADEPGHHPDMLSGLALAAEALVYCPAHFLHGRPEIERLWRRELTGSLDIAEALAVTRANMQTAYDDAADQGRNLLLNLFFDENWDSLPIVRHDEGMQLVHSLHRPAELDGTLGGINARKPRDAVTVLRRTAETDLVTVHTRHGLDLARQWLPEHAVLHVGWPCATAAEIDGRFDTARPATGEPHVLLIGEALWYKGPELLLEAVRGGQPLKIAGNLVGRTREWVDSNYPDVRVEWQPGWITRELMDRHIREASVIAFPYLDGFHEHGGASGAIIQALSYAKPIIITPTLDAKTPDAPSVIRIPADDPIALHDAIDFALSNEKDLHQAAQLLRAHMLDHHTYETHMRRIVERVDSRRTGLGKERLAWGRRR